VPTLGRRGFTLIEMLVVTAVIGVLSAVGYPKLVAALAKANVRSARSTAINVYQEARTLAARDARNTTVYFGQRRVWAVATPRRSIVGSGTIDTVAAVRDLFQRYGVTLAASPDSIVNLNIHGMGTGGGDHGFVITRAGYRDSITINAMGRVVK
jgi:prepilin-type N-terminal cleavage/methylation domain-containing protein